jgi:hypothetical protein
MTRIARCKSGVKKRAYVSRRPVHTMPSVSIVSANDIQHWCDGTKVLIGVHITGAACQCMAVCRYPSLTVHGGCTVQGTGSKVAVQVSMLSACISSISSICSFAFATSSVLVSANARLNLETVHWSQDLRHRSAPAIELKSESQYRTALKKHMNMLFYY